MTQLEFKTTDEAVEFVNLIGAKMTDTLLRFWLERMQMGTKWPSWTAGLRTHASKFTDAQGATPALAIAAAIEARSKTDRAFKRALDAVIKEQPQ